MKIRTVGAKLFHADGRTGRHNEANSRFSQFCGRAWKPSAVKELSISGDNSNITCQSTMSISQHPSPPLPPKSFSLSRCPTEYWRKTVQKVGGGRGGSNCVPIRISWWVIWGQSDIIPHVTVAIAINLFNFPLISTFSRFNPYPTAFPYGNGMVLHFYQQQESSTTKTVHKVINKGLKAYV